MKIDAIIPFLPLITTAAIVAGTILVAYLNYRWAERTRKLDLYKTVFPEKFKAAKELIEVTRVLSDLIYDYELFHPDAHNEQAQERILIAANDLSRSVHSQGWILGLDVDFAGDKFVSACLFRIGKPGGLPVSVPGKEVEENESRRIERIRSQDIINRLGSVPPHELIDYHHANVALHRAIENAIHTEMFDSLFAIKEKERYGG